MTRRTLEKVLVPFALAGGISLAYATPGTSSAYQTDLQNSHVEDATSKGIGQVNMITCIMAALKPDALVNEGDYLALVDESRCDTDSRSSSSNAGSGSTQSASYLTATVNSSRASNNDPMIAKAWIDESSEGHSATIYVRISATEAPTDTNPYGVFRLDFCGRASGLSSCVMNGYLEGTTSGLNYFQIESEESESNTTALRLNATNTTTGSGRMQIDRGTEQAAFAFAYNSSLFRRADDSGDQCFSRDASDPETGLSVWRYGLYDVNTGERITRNSGFPIEYTSNGTTYHGYLGYWGLNLPPDAMNTLTNGSTVQKVDYSGGSSTKTDYSVVKAGGKLTKYTKKTRTLHEMDKIKLNTFIGNDANDFFVGATPNTQYELYWDDAAGTFTVTGMMACGESGCTTQDLPTPQTVSVSYWTTRGGVSGWSQALGGELFIALDGASGSVDSTAVEVVYRTQDLVYPSDLPSTLYCVRDCPTSASMAAYFAEGSSAQSPFVASTFNNWNPSVSADVVQYGSNAASATLTDSDSAAVVFTNAEALGAHPQFQFGVRTGRLFPDLASAECEPGSGTYCDWRVNNVEVFYQWETGANPWNQFAAVKDSNGDFLEFDAPLQVTFEVPTGNAYGQYSGKSIVLQYGGFGELWGIPGYCVSHVTNEPVSCETQDSRYVPLFVIPFDETQGRVTADGHTYLVKWLEREIRFARKNPTVCDSAGLTTPSGITLPTESDLRNPSDPSSSFYIGEKPTVTDAARVIHGDVKF